MINYLFKYPNLIFKMKRQNTFFNVDPKTIVSLSAKLRL